MESYLTSYAPLVQGKHVGACDTGFAWVVEMPQGWLATPSDMGPGPGREGFSSEAQALEFARSTQTQELLAVLATAHRKG